MDKKEEFLFYSGNIHDENTKKLIVKPIKRMDGLIHWQLEQVLGKDVKLKIKKKNDQSIRCKTESKQSGSIKEFSQMIVKIDKNLYSAQIPYSQKGL